MRNRDKQVKKCLKTLVGVTEARACLSVHYETPLLGENYRTYNQSGLELFDEERDSVCLKASRYETFDEYLKDYPHAPYRLAAARQIFTTTRNYPVAYLILDELECGDLCFGFTTKMFNTNNYPFKFYGKRHEFAALHDHNVEQVLKEVWTILYGDVEFKIKNIKDTKQHIEVLRTGELEQLLAVVNKYNLKLEKFDDHLIFGKVS
jgi:hypothetical protein